MRAMPDSGAGPKRPAAPARRRAIRLVAGTVVSAGALAWVFAALLGAWPEVSRIRYRPLPTAGALAVAVLCTLSSGYLWLRTLRLLGAPLDFARGLRIWIVSQVARYVPGKVWHYAGRVYLAREAGVPTGVVGLSLVVELLLTVSSAAAVAAAGLAFAPDGGREPAWLLLLLPGLLVAAAPERVLRLTSRVLRRPPEERAGLALRLGRRGLLPLLAGYAAVWLGYGVSLQLLSFSTHEAPVTRIPALAGVFAAAWLAGLLSFVTPGGLGVREGVLATLLARIVPVPAALLLSLLSRVVLTLAELACVALVVAAGVRKRGPAPPCAPAGRGTSAESLPDDLPDR